MTNKNYDGLNEVTCRIVETGEIVSVPKTSISITLDFSEPYEILSWGKPGQMLFITVRNLSPVKIPDRFLDQFSAKSILSNADLRNTDLSNLDLTNIPKAVNLFNNSKLPASVGKINVSGREDFREFFRYSSGDIDLSELDVSSATNMWKMFSGFSGKINGIENWPVGNVSNFDGMFEDCDAINLDLSNWPIDHYNGIPLDFDKGAVNWELPRPKWAIEDEEDPGPGYIKCKNSKQIIKYVKIEERMSFGDIVEILDWGLYDGMIKQPFRYGGTLSLERVPNEAPQWTNSIAHLFELTRYEFEEIDDWDVSHIEDFSNSFASSAKKGGLENWNVVNGKNFENMFYRSDYNGNNGGWNMTNAENLNGMYFLNQRYNQDLSGWYVLNFQTEPTNFSVGASSWILPKPIWGTKGSHTETEKPIDPEVPEGEPSTPPTEEKPEEPGNGGESESNPTDPETPPTDPEEPGDGESEVPTDPEPENPTETDPENPEEPGEIDPPSKPNEDEDKPSVSVDDSLCPCNGNIIISFPVDKGDVLIDFKAELRISCFEAQPDVMEPVKKED